MPLHLIEIPDDERAGALRLAEALTGPWQTLSLMVGGEPSDIPVPPALATLIGEAMRVLGERGRVVLSTQPPTTEPDADAPAGP